MSRTDLESAKLDLAAILMDLTGTDQCDDQAFAEICASAEGQLQDFLNNWNRVKCDTCGVTKESGYITDDGDCWDCFEKSDPEGFLDYVNINGEEHEAGVDWQPVEWIRVADEYCQRVYKISIDDLGRPYADRLLGVISDWQPIEWVEHYAEKYDLERFDQPHINWIG